MDILSFLLISLKLLFFFYKFAFAIDSISSSESISDGGTTIVSVDGSFELGFFSPGSSKNRYLGIWYKKVPVRTVVWVANRINPINDSSGVLMISSTGSPVVVMSQNKTVVWSANSTKEAKSSVVLQLLNSGNLVLRDEQSSGGSYLWQSFDYPCDTMLPDMKIGWDLKTGLERRLSSWKSPDDPSPGDFTCGVELQGNPQIVMRRGSNKFYRRGPWNGITFGGDSDSSHNSVFEVKYVNNEDELYFNVKMIYKSMFSMVVLNKTRYLLELLTWSETNQNWNVYSYVPKDYCDNYGLCGAYGNCITNQLPTCQCLEGFNPKSTGYRDWSQGCVRNKALNYSKLDGFIKFNGLKLPDATNSLVSKSMNLEQCRVKCLENTSCMAYSNLDIRGRGNGCAMWFGDLIDIKQNLKNVQDLFIRMSASELGTKERPKMKIVVIVIATAAVAGVLIVGYYIYKKKSEGKGRTDHKIEDLELPLFKLNTIANATNNFSFNNKLGEGGFGPVYKGTLVDGQEIAVKRLSKISTQGINEIFNGDQNEGNTNRVVGTYGYMAPEYAIDGIFSIKSDIFSFGILLLELVSGKKNRGFYHPDYNLSLIGYAWKLWKEGRPLELIDPFLGESCNELEAIRCIHIGLLCLEHQPDDRPSMSSVVLMLGSDNALPEPKQPGFLMDRIPQLQPDSSNKPEFSNEVTISMLEAR
ncbi:hypothetical protein LWI28_022524 [Acer negundo]|uniref:Receptor-like serine/threonine-protein kinase n=1 Tax=Acer negundo TaxID=4023 RepID=A0AAD5J680_ACENE|nr:hypothetical protein LWI28_022524 [Acer negundo]